MNFHFIFFFFSGKEYKESGEENRIVGNTLKTKRKVEGTGLSSSGDETWIFSFHATLAELDGSIPPPPLPAQGNLPLVQVYSFEIHPDFFQLLSLLFV